MNQPALSLQDVNEVIKYFAVNIQPVIQSFTHTHSMFRPLYQKPSDHQQKQIIDSITARYQNYLTQNPIEIRILKKFVQRIQQVFEFFKLKSKNNSKNSLQLIQNQITQKLQNFLEKPIIPVHEIISFVVSLTQKATFTQILKQYIGGKPKRPKRSYLRSCTTAIKISAFPAEDNVQDEEDKRIRQRKSSLNQRGNHTTHQKKNNAKSHITFSAVGEHQNQCHPRIRPFSTKNLRSKQKRSESLQNGFSEMRKKSSKNGKFQVYFKIASKNQTNPRADKFVDFKQLYVDMNIDKCYMEKSIEKKQLLVREMLKRNQKIMANLRKQQKRQKNKSLLQESNAFQTEQKGQNLQKQRFKSSTSQYHEDYNVLAEMNMLNKRKCFRHRGYQNYLQKKKKTQDKGVNRKNTTKKISVENKENYQQFSS